MIKYLGEVLATSDSHKVITSFTGSEFLRNLHLHNRKGLFLMTGLQTRRRTYARTHARTQTVFVFPPRFQAAIPVCFSSRAIHTWLLSLRKFSTMLSQIPIRAFFLFFIAAILSIFLPVQFPVSVRTGVFLPVVVQ